jgi:uncharacterized membrane protein YeaQ/YmgE (transglycosylase-associated protein family)
MDWLQHLLIGMLMGCTVSLITVPVSLARVVKNTVIGALAASLGGALWSPVFAGMDTGVPLHSLAPLWSMGVAMVAVIGSNELRRTARER